MSRGGRQLVHTNTIDSNIDNKESPLPPKPEEGLRRIARPAGFVPPSLPPNPVKEREIVASRSPSSLEKLICSAGRVSKLSKRDYDKLNAARSCQNKPIPSPQALYDTDPVFRAFVAEKTSHYQERMVDKPVSVLVSLICKLDEDNFGWIAFRDGDAPVTASTPATPDPEWSYDNVYGNSPY